MTSKGKARPLDIVGFDDREQRHPPGVDLPEWMPMHEFFMLVVAPAGSGKTTLILNLLLRIYTHYFNRIIVFSPTIHNDQKWKYLTNQKNVLRANPHQKLWKSEVDQGEEQEGNDGPDKWAPEEKEWLETQQDTFLIENFKDKKGSKKRLGNTQYRLWKQLGRLPGQVTGTRMADANTIIERKRRLDRLTAMLVKPTPPLLAQNLRDYHDIIGLPPPNLTIAQDGRWGSSLAGDMAIAGPSGRHGAHGYGSLRGRRGKGRGGRGGSRGVQSAFPPPRTYHYPGEETGAQEGEESEEDNEDKHNFDNVASHDNRSGIHARKHGKVSKKDLHEEYSEETLEEAMKYQDKVVRCLTNKKLPMTHADHLCWVFDDMVGSGLFNQKRNNAFKRLSVRRRHFCSSVIGVVQAYKEFPKTSRTNCNVYILFRIDNEDELDMIYKDFPCGLTWDHWKTVFDYCTREPYSFMMINTQVKDPQYKIVKNFDEPLFLPLNRLEHPRWIVSFQGDSVPTANREEEEVTLSGLSPSQKPSKDTRRPCSRSRVA